MMNIILVIGLLTLSQTLHGQSANDLSASSTEPILQKLIPLCSFLSFPLNDSCIKIISLTSHEDIENVLRTESLKGLYHIIEAHYMEQLESFKRDIFSPEHAENPAECLLCKLIMKELEKILPRNPSKDKIKKALVKVCKAFSGKIKAKCQIFITINSKKIIEYLLQKYAPKKLCKLLLVCPDTSTDYDNVFDTLTNWTETFHDYSAKQQIKDKDGTNPITCEICKRIIKHLMNIFRQKKTKEAIQKGLKSVCGIIPSRWKQICEQLVNRYSDKIVDFILDHTKPSMICFIIRACFIYEKTPNYIQSVVNNVNPTDGTDPIFHQIKSLCSLLPFPLNENCNKVISLMSSEHSDNNLKTQRETIEGRDENLENDEKNDLSKEHPESFEDCVLCRKIMKLLDNILPRKPTKDKIKKALVKVCKAFSGKKKAKCQIFITINSKKIIEYLLLKYAPKKLCKLLLVCPDTLIAFDKVFDIGMDQSETFHSAKQQIDDKENVKEEDDVNPVTCEACEEMVQKLKILIQDDKSKEFIEKAWKIFRTYLPDILSHQFEGLVHQYRDQILKVINDGLEPSKICAILQLCSTNDDVLDI